MSNTSATQAVVSMAPDILSAPGSESTTTTNYVSMEMGNANEYPGEQFNDEEEEDDNVSLTTSIVSSVMTADGIHDLTGFIVVCFVILIGDMSRGVFFPTMWPLVSELGGSTITLGYAVASFSFGRIFTNPMFGAMSVEQGYTKTLLASVSILFVGTLVYTQIQNVGSSGCLIAAQIVQGIGSGTLGVTRAFVADITAKRQRTTYMAWITAVQYAGFTVTPFIGALLVKLFGDNEFIWGPIRLNQYTSPAYFMSIICLITLVCLKLFFKDRFRQPTQKKKKMSARQAAVDEVSNRRAMCGMMTVYDSCIVGCMLLNIATKGSIASFETLGIAYAETHFHLLSQQAGSVVASCGCVGVLTLLSMGYLSQKFTDIQLICGGMVVMAAGIVSLTGVEDGLENPHWRYFLALFLIYSIGYPIGHTAVIGLFSKIVGRKPQGILLGWFASAGSLARMTFPIMSGYVASFADVIVLFYILTAILFVGTIFALYNRPTLILLSS